MSERSRKEKAFKAYNVLLQQEKAVVEEEIRLLTKKKREREMWIKEEKDRMTYERELIQKGGVLDASFFHTRGSDTLSLKKWEEEQEKDERELKLCIEKLERIRLREETVERWKKDLQKQEEMKKQKQEETEMIDSSLYMRLKKGVDKS